jgi:hypothetical protein
MVARAALMKGAVNFNEIPKYSYLAFGPRAHRIQRTCSSGYGIAHPGCFRRCGQKFDSEHTNRRADFTSKCSRRSFQNRG